MKIAIYGQYFKEEDKIYVEELINTLTSNSIDFVIEKNYYSGLKKKLKISKVKTFASYKDLDKSFDIVHLSNMSKLCVDEAEAKRTVDNYKETQTKYDSPNLKKSENGDYWVVYNESTGKILKSIKYTPANFESMLN